jgi:hypothetical protein
MPNTSNGRVFREEDPTGKFESEQLDKLVARSVEKSAVLKASVDGDFVTAPYPAATPPVPSGPTPSSPEFLGKGSAVLVLPSEPAAPAASPVFAAAIAPPPAPAAAVVHVPAPPPVQPAPAPAVLPAPAPTQPSAREAPTQPAARAATVVRSHRRISARATVKPRRRVWRQVIKLALLALVVLCQPWWWNVGDLNARPTAPAAPAAATK